MKLSELGFPAEQLELSNPDSQLWEMTIIETGITVGEYAIVTGLATELGFHLQHLRRPNRARPASTARQIISYILRTRLGWELTRIGEILDRDHSTISYNVDTVQGWLDTSAIFREEIEQLLYSAATKGPLETTENHA